MGSRHEAAGLEYTLYLLAEREGFEPPEPCGSTVFKTAAFDRSATSPVPDRDCHHPARDIQALPRNAARSIGKLREPFGLCFASTTGLVQVG